MPDTPAAESEATSCHAPPSDDNVAELIDEILVAWDRRHALSRATLRRWITRIARAKRPFAGTPGEARGALSRATFEA
jgi:hypothetical protein